MTWKVKDVALLAVIVALALVDAAGFWFNLALLLRDQPGQSTLVIVAGCAVCAVVLPALFGATLAERRASGDPSGTPTMIVTGTTWVGLATTMFYIRATAPIAPTGTGPTAAAASSVTQGQLPLAPLLLIIYVTGGVIAFTHAYNLQRRACLWERKDAYTKAPDLSAKAGQ